MKKEVSKIMKDFNEYRQKKPTNLIRHLKKEKTLIFGPHLAKHSDGVYLIESIKRFMKNTARNS